MMMLWQGYLYSSHKHLVSWLDRELMSLKQVHVAYNTSKAIQTLGGEGKSSVKAKANGIAINSW